MTNTLKRLTVGAVSQVNSKAGEGGQGDMGRSRKPMVQGYSSNEVRR